MCVCKTGTVKLDCICRGIAWLVPKARPSQTPNDCWCRVTLTRTSEEREHSLLLFNKVRKDRDV